MWASGHSIELRVNRNRSEENAQHSKFVFVYFILIESKSAAHHLSRLIIFERKSKENVETCKFVTEIDRIHIDSIYYRIIAAVRRSSFPIFFFFSFRTFFPFKTKPKMTCNTN